MTKELFEKITKWQKETFPTSTEVSKLLHLEEELSELMEEAKSSKPSFHNKRMEYADCFFLLYGAAEKSGLTYEDICVAINQKYEINKTRNWSAPDKNGVSKHVS